MCYLNNIPKLQKANLHINRMEIKCASFLSKTSNQETDWHSLMPLYWQTMCVLLHPKCSLRASLISIHSSAQRVVGHQVCL